MNGNMIDSVNDAWLEPAVGMFSAQTALPATLYALPETCISSTEQSIH